MPNDINPTPILDSPSSPENIRKSEEMKDNHELHAEKSDNIECEIHENQGPENPGTQNAIPDDSTVEIECEILDTMKIPDNEITDGERINAENSMLDDSTTDMECEVLDTMDDSIADSPVSLPVPLPVVEFESVGDLTKDAHLELDDDLRYYLFTATFKRVISTNDENLIDNPTYNLYYEKVAKQVKPYLERLDAIGNFARDISAELLSVSGKIKLLKSDIFTNDNKKSVRESIRENEFHHYIDILKAIRDQLLTVPNSEIDVYAHLEDYDLFVHQINHLFTQVVGVCDKIKR